MTIAAALAIINAIVAAYPVVKGGIEAICNDVAAAHGLDPIELIKAVSTPDFTGVDASIDAELNARLP